MNDDPDLRDLPTLDRWGDELRDAAQHAERRTDRRRLPIRRFALAVAVMLLAVPGAIATRSIWMDPLDTVDPARDPQSTPAVQLAHGRSGDIAWRLGAYDRRDARCVQLQTSVNGDDLGGGCSPVPADDAQIVAATGARADLGFVFGTVATDVAEVVVIAAGGRRMRVRTVEPTPDVLRRARLPMLRVFLVAFKGEFDPTVAPVVVALDDHGNELGRQGSTGSP